MGDSYQQITGTAAPLAIPNLDTDQIMPKQFLRGVDKSGLDRGVLYDLRFDGDGRPRAEFVLNRPAYQGTTILVAAENFGCGSSREHAVWGLLQYGIVGIVAPSFGEIFYSNALNNGLVAAAVREEDVTAFWADVAEPHPSQVTIDLQQLRVTSCRHAAEFTLSRRHHSMLLEGHDQITATLAHLDTITAYADRHFEAQPWIRDVGRQVPSVRVSFDLSTKKA